jgi:hypothetical protein
MQKGYRKNSDKMQTIAMDLIQIAIKNVFMSWTRESSWGRLSEWQRAKMQTINLPFYDDYFEIFLWDDLKI